MKHKRHNWIDNFCDDCGMTRYRDQARKRCGYFGMRLVDVTIYRYASGQQAWKPGQGNKVPGPCRPPTIEANVQQLAQLKKQREERQRQHVIDLNNCKRNRHKWRRDRDSITRQHCIVCDARRTLDSSGREIRK